MKIFKNKWIFGIVVSIFALFVAQFYFITNSFQRDTSSYVTLIQGQWRINSELLSLNQKESLQPGDIIATIGENSLAVIEWWDKSITRLWWNSRIEVKENFVWSDLEKINISFELLKWRTWSNVISIMWENSYFHQEVRESVAAVRWTVFEVDYEKDYIFVSNHQVKFTTSLWEDIFLDSWEGVSLTKFDVLWNILDIRDKAWAELNSKLDAEYLEELRQEFLQTFLENNPFNFVKHFDTDYKIVSLLQENNPLKLSTYIQSLPEEKQIEVVSKIDQIHQWVNFENWENSTLYNIKQNARNVLIENKTDEEKKTYLRYTLYDVNEMIQKNFSPELIEKNIKLLQENRDFLTTQAQSNVFWVDPEVLKNILFTNDPEQLLKDMTSKFKELEQKWQNFIHNTLNDLFKR